MSILGLFLNNSRRQMLRASRGWVINDPWQNVVQNRAVKAVKAVKASAEQRKAEAEAVEFR